MCVRVCACMLFMVCWEHVLRVCACMLFKVCWEDVLRVCACMLFMVCCSSGVPFRPSVGR